MACECGWDHNFIFDNFTLDQVTRYRELIENKKLKDAQMQTIVTSKSVQYAFGSIKKKDFIDFVDSLNKDKDTPDESFKKMKTQGFPVEDK